MSDLFVMVTRVAVKEECSGTFIVMVASLEPHPIFHRPHPLAGTSPNLGEGQGGGGGGSGCHTPPGLGFDGACDYWGLIVVCLP